MIFMFTPVSGAQSPWSGRPCTPLGLWHRLRLSLAPCLRREALPNSAIQDQGAALARRPAVPPRGTAQPAGLRCAPAGGERWARRPRYGDVVAALTAPVWPRNSTTEQCGYEESRTRLTSRSLTRAVTSCPGQLAMVQFKNPIHPMGGGVHSGQFATSSHRAW